jgi:5-(carboxyamino)imidazole ribonucleotide synthase
MSQAFYQDFKLGVLGGGQLGRMLIQSAIDFNLDVYTIDPDPSAPCKNISTEFSHGSLKDFDAVYNFGKKCDLITIEIESVNIQALKKLQEEGKKVFPQPEIIELIQDKRVQKTFYKDHNIPTADFVLTETREDLKKYKDIFPAVHKLGKEGYDGRGVQKIKNEEDIPKGFDAPGVLEKMIDFEKEISIIVARNERGEMVTFPAVELVFHPEANLVEYLFSPAQISKEVEQKATEIARDVIKKLDMIGLLAVEMFVTKDQQVLVNEIAPRTHNSGHQTIEANITSQFEQHLRAILNMPLGSTEMKIPSAMVNLLGEDGYSGMAKYEGLDEVLAVEGAHVHLYGKKLTKPFRKMGHVTIVDHDMERLKEKANFVKNTLKIKA